jgi:hypothetical protein
MILDLDKEMAWITFMEDGWESTWHPITGASGKQLEWSKDIMNHCRAQFNNWDWKQFGIAPTSQMLLKNAVRDNL